MTKRIHKLAAGVLAIGALGLGGSAIAQGASSTEPVGGPDTDAIQSGDQTTPDTASAAAAAAAPKSSANAPAANSAAAEPAGSTEQPGAAETPGAEAPGSESAANSDGPGGHADEPGNPNADNQFQGVQ